MAVGGSSLERAQTLASTYSIPRAYGSYDEVASDPEVEIVYVCTLHPAHKPAVIAASGAGKAVLCEKPLAMNAKDAEAMIGVAHANGTFFMEAMWSRYFPAIQKIRSLIKDGRIGEIVSFDAKLGYLADMNMPRIGSKENGASSILDVGIYPITMASMVLGPEAPIDIQSTAKMHKSGDFDVQFASVIRYKSGIATVQGSFEAPFENTATVVGTKGRIHWRDFWCPSAFVLTTYDGHTEHFDAANNPEFALPIVPGHKFNFHNSAGLCFEAKYIQDALERGIKESEHESHEESITIMKTIDIIAKQIGFNNY